MANSASRSLYEKVIIEHNKSPRNFREMADAHRSAEGFNPLCGDEYTVELKLEGDTIADVAFHGAGCAISKSSGSIMTSIVKGRSVAEAKALFEEFHRMVTSEPGSDVDQEGLGKLAVFSGVRDFPLRIKCATWTWHALQAAIEGKEEAVTTE
jgi:nitrogen fixation NifU-like protein